MNEGAPDLIIVDPELRSLRGHYFHYDKSLANEAARRGLQTLILAARDFNSALQIDTQIRRVFSGTIWVLNPHPMFGNALLHFPKMLTFFLQVKRALNSVQLTGNAVIFFPTLLGYHIFSISLLNILKSRVVLMLRYAPDFYQSSIWARLGFWMLRKHVRSGDVSLVADSEILADEFSRLLRLPVETLPIPHTSSIADENDNKDEQTPLRLTYLGDARLEKGIIELFDAICSLKMSDEWKFVLQVSDPDSAKSRKAIAKLRAAKRSDIELFESALSEKDYRTLLETADIVLMPYRAKDYQHRSSGILAEAIAAGKPVIVTSETWLSNCVKSFDTGLVCACEADAIAAAIVECCEKISSLQEKAKQASSVWSAKHNAGECLDRILLHPSRRKTREDKS